MKLYTVDSLPGRDYEPLGAVRGAVVYSKHFGRDLAAGLKGLVGGELVGYTEMLNEARQIATDRMTDAAAELGADAVIGLRYASAALMQGAAEILAYGTAVKFK